jgi:MYXO-CTERM domain-containing protein
VGTGGGCYGVGLDPADDTLWCTEYSGGRLFQYNKSGTLLNTVSTELGSTFGAEFAVPAPGALALLAFGGLASARRRRA